MQLSHSEQLITEGYCVHCINTKTSLEKCRKITNKLNLFAHFCNVCTAIFGTGTEFLAGMKSLDNFELLSLDDDELAVIRRKDRIIYDKIILFKDHVRS